MNVKDVYTSGYPEEIIFQSYARNVRVLIGIVIGRDKE